MSRFGSLADPPATFVVRGARLIDPGTGLDRTGDLAVVDGRLADGSGAPTDAPQLDGQGLIVAPAFCDLHAHLREPGDAGAETIASGTRAAAHGGFASVCAMPNTDPPADEVARIGWLLDRAAAASARVRVVGAATLGRRGESLPDLAAMAECGIVGVSDDGAAVASSRLARNLLIELAALGLPLIEHAEDAELAAGSVMRSGPTATRLGLAGWPASAELTVVERDIALARETGARVHFTHLSTAAALDAIRRARGEGIRVTCDVTPHHLAMTDAWVAGSRAFAWEDQPDPLAAPDPGRAYDAACRVNPPLPSRDDALALLAGLDDGTVDAIATDHAPHPPQRKEVEFADAAPGLIGLETALSIGLAAVDAGHLRLGRLLAVLGSGPAALIGEERGLATGTLADLVVFEPAARWRVTADGLASASANTPLLGMELPGVVRLTMAGGRITYRDGLGDDDG
jgi:dihydroorotase